MSDKPEHQHQWKPFRGYLMCQYEWREGDELRFCAEVVTGSLRPLTTAEREALHEAIRAEYQREPGD